jgi:methylenetetrahydrofolate reductase (NADPH)
MSFDEIHSQKPVVSLEVFPPKPDMPADVIDETLVKLRALSPAFVSVTYGAGGSQSARTAEIAARIPDLCGCPALGHLTCAGADSASIMQTLRSFEESGVKAVLALRGDVPKGMDAASAFKDFKYASELVTLIRENADMTVAAACYPEGHYQSPSSASDLERLKFKVDCGVDFLITQLFFDNAAFFSFMDKARRIGINVPIHAGLMPVLNAQQILRMTTLCGASIPATLSRLFARYADDDKSFAKAGMDFCCEQILDLKRNDIDGIHFYTMNRPKSTAQILQRTGLRDAAAE